ncbi:pitrilysin family protein [Sporosarcina sp. HYO08]|uniref:M16 family metallopeptidase n=1 Tax=Sporosarcina sp. HYO08 TaxID=1759557 RepID=UPI000791AF1E|nr:pitrilysin family protein [Sporosarcina sp. HYO08]KXH80029.1 zinc protease [Sporosarcina sp. HYO08]
MIEKYVCQNGVRIVFEKMPYVRSVAIGLWVGAGSSDELEKEAGIAHFLEHMLFKGTKTRTARMIAEQFDQIGGDINAFTSKEMTCYFTTVLDHHASRALSILADMFFNSTFAEEEIKKEKMVILDEIATVEDTPDDDVDERLWSKMYANDAIGKPVLGHTAAIEKFNEEMIRHFKGRLYTPENLVISIAGNYDERLILLVESLFGTFRNETIPIESEGKKQPIFQSGVTIKTKETEQAHICMGFPGLAVRDEKLYDLILLDSIFGGTMSSRLFQEVREERGLAYSVYSYYAAYREAGAFVIYGGCAPNNLKEMTTTIDGIIERTIYDGFSKNELHNAKEQLKGGFLLSLESSESRMHRNGKNELLLRNHKTIEEVEALIERVEADDVHKMAQNILSKKHAVSIIGPELIRKERNGV